MPIFDTFRGKKFKTELEAVQAERDQLKAALADTERMSYVELQQSIVAMTATRDQLNQEIEALRTKAVKEQEAIETQVRSFQQRKQAENAELERQLAEKKKELVATDDLILLQSFGLYTPKYEFQHSEAYKARLEQIRKAQETMVRAGTATQAPSNMQLNNSLAEGKKMINDYVKLIVRSFNNECDACMVAVKFNNIDTIKKRIEKSFSTLNTLGKRLGIALLPAYLDLKLQELHLCYEYQMKKQQEKEEQKLIREQLREEAKVAREIEEMKAKIEKEEKHFLRAQKTLQAQLAAATDETSRVLILNELSNVEQKLSELGLTKEDVLRREQNTRAGYVYVISNIGAFGENVFKIGVTRRLDPQERIDELGDASVPFEFDVHALIFSDDAPALENAIHRAFETRRLNMINRRREFFSVSVQEIDDVVKKHFQKPYEFVELADAKQYRESLLLRQSMTSLPS